MFFYIGLHFTTESLLMNMHYLESSIQIIVSKHKCEDFME